MATIHIESVADAAATLISFGSDLEVLSPPALRAALVSCAHAVIDVYR